MSNIFIECFDTVFEEFNIQTNYNESVFSKLREDAIFNLCKYYIDGKYIQNINNDYLLLKNNNLNKYSIEKLNEFYQIDEKEYNANLHNIISELQSQVIEKLSLITNIIKSSFEFTDTRSYVNIYPNLFDFEYEKDLINNINPFNSIYLLIQTIINSVIVDHFPSRVNESDFNIFRNKVNLYFNKYLKFYDAKWYDLSILVEKKCLFLVNKYELRKVAESIEYNKHFNPNNNLAKNSILVRQQDGSSSQFNASKFLNASYRIDFKKMNEYILNHYELNTDYKKYYNSNLSNYGDKIDLLSLHKRIKYSKDISNDDGLSKLNEILEIQQEIIETINDENDVYGKFSSKLSYIYCIGNYFSLFVENENNLEKIYAEYKKLSQKCSDYKYFNYFLTSKLIYKISKCFKNINDAISDGIEIESNEKQNFEYISNKRIKLDEIIKIYVSNRNWVKNNMNYFYLIEFENSFHKVPIVGKVYIFSSYFLPVSLNDLKYKTEADIKYIENHYLSIKNYLKNDNDLKTNNLEVKKIREQFEETKQKLETKELESLKVIFSVAGVLTFVAGSVQGFQFINTYSDFLFFFIPFGLSIALITSFIISYINNKITKNSNNYTPTVIIGGLLVIFFIIQICFSSQIIKNSIDQQIIKENRINEIIKERDSLIKSTTEIKKTFDSTTISKKNKIDSLRPYRLKQ